MMDFDIEKFDDDDDEQNLNPLLRDELEFLLLRMLELVEECYTNLMHHSIRRSLIPQRTSILTGLMWVHCVRNDNKNICYEGFRMGPSTFLTLCNTLK